MDSSSRKKSNKKRRNLPKMDILSLDGTECYYDLDMFIKIMSAKHAVKGQEPKPMKH